MLRRLEIDSFKAFDRVDVPVQPFTAIVGPNGTGKTSFLQALELLGAMTRGQLGAALDDRGWSYPDLPRLHATNKEFGFVAHVDLDGRAVEWELRFGKRRRPGIAREHVRVDGAELMTRTGRRMRRVDETTGETESVQQTLTSSWLATVADEDADRYPTLVALASWSRRILRYMALTPTRLREPSRGADALIGPSGEGLASFLRALRDRTPDRYERVVARVREHYPQLVDVHVKRKQYGWSSIEILEDWDSGPVSFNSRQVSDGLLRLLAVSAMQELAEPPSVLMIDEIENGMHPHLLEGLMSLLQHLAHDGPTQVVVTSHSPIALNYVTDPQATLIAYRSPDGAATLTPLAEAKGFRGLAESLDPGELWYNLGESRLLTGRGR